MKKKGRVRKNVRRRRRLGSWWWVAPVGMVFVRRAHKTMPTVSTIWIGATVELVVVTMTVSF
jgi:hypothetical protein